MKALIQKLQVQIAKLSHFAPYSSFFLFFLNSFLLFLLLFLLLLLFFQFFFSFPFFHILFLSFIYFSSRLCYLLNFLFFLSFYTFFSVFPYFKTDNTTVASKMAPHPCLSCLFQSIIFPTDAPSFYKTRRVFNVSFFLIKT